MKRLLLLPFLLFLTLPAHAARVQGAVSNYTPRTSVSLAFPSNQTAGNLNVVLVDDARSNPPTISDTLGNTYVNLYCTNFFGAISISCAWYSENILAGANTVTISWTGGNAGGGTAIAEYSNVKNSGSLDQHPALNFSTGTAWSDSAGTSTADHETWINFVACVGNIATVSGGFTAYQQIQGGGITFAAITDALDKATGGFNANGTCGASNKWIAFTATFFPDPVGVATQIGSFLVGP